jgi:high-affinity iron transporter
MDRAGALLKSGVDPTAAAINAGSIVLREGLEGLLVIVAILAGLRGAENRNRRYLLWAGVLAAGVATAATYVLSQTILARLHAYAEIIEAVTALLAIGVLLLITNWLFHQIYWNQWVTTLKTQAAEGESPWQLISVGFLIGYREGFETVLFLQSLVLDVGGGPVGTGVAIGGAVLFACGFAALVLGLRLPYFKLLMVTALLIGLVLLAFVGNGVRAMQTVGWLGVHRIADVSWPAWVGQWLGVYNTWETVIAQVVIGLTVIGTWRVSRFTARRAAARRAAARAAERRLAAAAAETAMAAATPRGAACAALACDAASPSACRLNQLGVGCRGSVVAIGGAPEVRRRLGEMGLRHGVTVEVVRHNSPGRAVEFRVRGNRCSLEHAYARHVEVAVEA